VSDYSTEVILEQENFANGSRWISLGSTPAAVNADGDPITDPDAITIYQSNATISHT